MLTTQKYFYCFLEQNICPWFGNFKYNNPTRSQFMQVLCCPKLLPIVTIYTGSCYTHIAQFKIRQEVFSFCSTTNRIPQMVFWPKIWSNDRGIYIGDESDDRITYKFAIKINRYRNFPLVYQMLLIAHLAKESQLACWKLLVEEVKLMVTWFSANWI